MRLCKEFHVGGEKRFSNFHFFWARPARNPRFRALIGTILRADQHVSMVSHRHRAGFCNAPHASASVAESTDVRPCETRRRGTLDGFAARSLRRSADVARMWSARCERFGTPAVSASHSPNAGVLLARHPSLEKRRNTSDEWVWRRRMIIRRPVFRPVSAGSALSRW